MREDAARLTPRQREILRLLADGEGTAEIATTLGLGSGTVRRHLRSALRRLGERRQSVPSTLSSTNGAAQSVPSRNSLSGPRHRTTRTTGERALGRYVADAARMHGAFAVLALVNGGGPPAPFEPVAAAAAPGHAVAALEQGALTRQGFSLRREDFIMTWRDDTVVILLPGSDLVGAEAVARRLRTDVRTGQYAIGAAQWRPGEGPGALVARAERVAGLDRLQRQAERSLTRATRKR